MQRDADKDAEAQPGRGSRLLFDALEDLEDGIVLYDADDRLVLANRRILELVPALAPNIVPGVHFGDMVRAAAALGYYPADGRPADEVVSERLARELPPGGRIELHVDAGRVVQVKERRTRDGGRLIVVTDVTDLRRATTALAVSEQNYRLMVDGVDDIIYRIDPNGFFTYVSRRVSETMGWTAEQLVGTCYLDLIRPDFRPSAQRFYIRQFGRRIPTTYFEFPAISREGCDVWIGQHVRLVEESGDVVGALAVARDITARKRAEEHERDRQRIVETIAQSAPLAETLGQLVSLFERRAPGWKAAVFLVQGESLVVGAAPSWPARLVKALTGSALRSTVQRLVRGEREGTVPDDAEALSGHLVSVLNADEPSGWSVRCAPVRGRDGAAVGVWATIAAQRQAPGTEMTQLVPELAQLAAIAIERARMTERLEARVARAQALNDITRLISSSLDLETVLSGIARAASALLGAPVVRFWMMDEESQSIWLAAHVSELPGLTRGAPRVNVADLRGILGWVTRHQQPVRIPVAAADPRVVDAAWWAERGLTSYLGQPVILDGRLLAVLSLWGREPFAFDDDDEALLESFASQTALSIRNAQLYRDTDQQRQRLQSLVEVSHRLSRGLNLTEVLDAIVDAAATIFGGEAGLLLLVGDELVRASISRGARQRPTAERITTVGGLVGEVLRTGRPMATPDAASDERIPDALREMLQGDRLSALLIAPIRHEQRLLGTLHIYRERGHEWRDDTLRLAASLADQAATAIENATRYAGLQDSLERAKIPARVNQLLSAALDLDVLLREIASAAVKVTGAVVATIWLVDQGARTLRLVVFSDEEIGREQTFRHAAFGEGAAGWVAQHRTVLHVDDIFEDGRTGGLDWWRRHDLRSSYTVPVMDGDELVAVLSINGREPILVGDDNRELLASLVAQTAAALRNAALYREISAANRRLEREVRRNELLLNSVADGVFGVDADGCITFVNPAALRMLGYTSAELLGQDAHLILHHASSERLSIDPEHCPSAHELRSGLPYHNSDDTLWRRDDRPLAVACVGTPLLEDGAPVGAVVTFRDISREKQAERQRQALAQNEKLRALGQLAGGVAHDLNQSLGLVVGHSELALGAIRGRPDVPPELRESLETIMQGALDGAQTVRRLQTFVRGQPDGEAERVSMGSLITDVVRLTAPRWRDAAQAAGTPVTVTVNLEMAGEDEILGWPASLREALTNLVLNALDAMPGGGALHLALEMLPEHVVVEVADTGTGMPPEVAARIFEPFFTTKGERGTGLGLAMVYGIVERHAGKIEVDSTPGRGTTIRISLPRAARSRPADPVSKGETTSRAQTILIVDDEAALRRMLARMLAVDGHTVVAAATANEALEQLGQQRFDLVLSDHGLGLGMNGLELATIVQERWPGTRFILVTGWGGTIDPDEVRALGVEAVISKPYRAPELRQRVNAVPS